MPATTSFPDALPVLSSGRHRNPRDGGCAMEWVSLLAGERWSDHPACTHPLLAHLTRSVNDLVGDRARAALTHLVPALVGLRGGDDAAWSLEIASVAARHAVRRSRPWDRRDLLVAVLTLDHLLAAPDARPPSRRRAATTALLATVPGSDVAWAERFTRAMGAPRHVRGLARRVVDVSVATVTAAPGTAASGAAASGTAAPGTAAPGTAASGADDALVAMLTDAVGTCLRLSDGADRDAPVPRPAARATGPWVSARGDR